MIDFTGYEDNSSWIKQQTQNPDYKVHINSANERGYLLEGWLISKSRRLCTPITSANGGRGKGEGLTSVRVQG